jgi:hypothetical protein
MAQRLQGAQRRSARGRAGSSLDKWGRGGTILKFVGVKPQGFVVGRSVWQ